MHFLDVAVLDSILLDDSLKLVFIFEIELEELSLKVIDLLLKVIQELRINAWNILKLFAQFVVHEEVICDGVDMCLSHIKEKVFLKEFSFFIRENLTFSILKMSYHLKDVFHLIVANKAAFFF